jgi:Glycosyltransferase WbsX
MRARRIAHWLGPTLALVVFTTGFSIAAVKLAPYGSVAPRPSSAPPRVRCARPPTPPLSPAARVGAYYFDGWAGPFGDPHFRGLLQGPFVNREPLYGWRDTTPGSMRSQLYWAHRYGIGFFVFDWYYGGDQAPESVYLDNALRLYRQLSNHDGVGQALLYVNAKARQNFVIPPADWPTVVQQWTRSDFASKDYVRIAGKPLLVIYDVGRFTQQFHGEAGVNAALQMLRDAARAQGYPGVFIVGGIYVGATFDWNWYAHISTAENFDAFTQYAYPAAPGIRSGQRPYREVSSVAEANWSRFATGAKPFIPDVMTGWDPRPWQEKVAGQLWWYQRSPAQVGSFVQRAIQFEQANPTMRFEPPSAPPLLLIEAWNELGEGAYILPTVGSCHAYGRAIARALGPVG